MWNPKYKTIIQLVSFIASVRAVGLRRTQFSIYLPDETGRFLPEFGSS